MIRMVTPNTNVTPGSIDTTFLGDKSVTGAKINTTGALDNQVLSYDSATDTVIWQDISTLDNTFENGIIVTGAQSTFAEDVQINADLDLNGDISISGSITDLTAISADSAFTLSSTGSITLNADSDGDDSVEFIHADTGNLYVGSFSQAVHITPSSIGAVGNSIAIAGDFTGDLTGNVTGDLDGNVDAERVEINNSTKIDPGNWNQFSFDPFGIVKLAVASTSIPTQFVRERSDNSSAFVDTLVSKRTGDITGMESVDDLIIHNNVFTDTAGGGQRRASSFYTRLRNIDVIGTDTSDYEYDIYDSEVEVVIYDKATGANEVSHNVATFGSEGQKFHNQVEVFTKPTNSGDIDLSSVQLAYVGTSKDAPDAYIRLIDNNAGPAMTNMVRFRDQGSGVYKTEFETDVEFNNNAITEVSSLQVGNLTLTGDEIQSAGEVEFNADFNVTGTSFFGSGSGTQISSSGAISAFGSNTAVPVNSLLQLNRLSSDPTGVEGAIYFNTTTNKFRGYDGTNWVDLN